MMKEQIYSLIEKRIKKGADLDIKDDMVLTELGFNSLDIVELISEIEDVYNIEISEREIVNFRTVKDIKDYIELKSCRSVISQNQ